MQTIFVHWPTIDEKLISEDHILYRINKLVDLDHYTILYYTILRSSAAFCSPCSLQPYFMQGLIDRTLRGQCAFLEFNCIHVECADLNIL